MGTFQRNLKIPIVFLLKSTMSRRPTARTTFFGHTIAGWQIYDSFAFCDRMIGTRIFVLLCYVTGSYIATCPVIASQFYDKPPCDPSSCTKHQRCGKGAASKVAKRFLSYDESIWFLSSKRTVSGHFPLQIFRTKMSRFQGDPIALEILITAPKIHVHASKKECLTHQ